MWTRFAGASGAGVSSTVELLAVILNLSALSLAKRTGHPVGADIATADLSRSAFDVYLAG